MIRVGIGQMLRADYDDLIIATGPHLNFDTAEDLGPEVAALRRSGRASAGLWLHVFVSQLSFRLHNDP